MQRRAEIIAKLSTACCRKCILFKSWQRSAWNWYFLL